MIPTELTKYQWQVAARDYNSPFIRNYMWVSSTHLFPPLLHIPRIVIGIVAMVKIGSAAAIVGRIGEKWYHTIIIGVLIIVAPYAWDLLGSSITPMLPSWAQ